MGLGPPEIILVLVVVLLLFGSAKLPKLARSLGQAQKEFREGQRESLDATDDPAEAKKTES